MTTPPPHNVTRLSIDWNDGDRRAPDELLPPVGGEARRLVDCLRRGRPRYNSRVLGTGTMSGGRRAAGSGQ